MEVHWQFSFNFNSKGDNLRQVEFRTDFEAVCWGFLIK